MEEADINLENSDSPVFRRQQGRKRRLSESEEEEELSESESSSEEEEPVAGNPRRSTRLQDTSLKSAFEILRGGDYNEFLEHPAIAPKITSAFDLTKNIGHGTQYQTVLDLWTLHWEGILEIGSARQFHTKLWKSSRRSPDDPRIARRLRIIERDLKRSRCIFCNSKRCLTYYARDSSQVWGYLGLIGADCFEVKFSALTNLTDVCRRLLAEMGQPNFEEIARYEIGRAIVQIREAPVKMGERYNQQ